MGAPVRSIFGHGILKYSDGFKDVACSITLTVQHDGDVELACATSPSTGIIPQWAVGFFGPMPLPTAFEGSTVAGENVLVYGPFLAYPGDWSTSGGASASFVLTGPARAEVHATPAAIECEWRFGVVNFSWTSRFLPAHNASQTVFQLGELSVPLKRVGGEESNRLLSSGSRVALTGELCLPGDLAPERAEELASDLCAILSIAEGTLINWIYAEKRTDDGTRRGGFYRSSVTRRYNGSLPLIDPNEDSELVNFVERAYGPYVSKKRDYPLAVIARAVPDVRTDGFLETRCLQFMSLIECIVSRDAEIHGSALVIDNELFATKLPTLSSRVRAALASTFPDASGGDLDALSGHLRGLNYTSFRRRLLATAKRLGVSIEKAEVSRLSETRNELVHRGRFSTKAPLEEVKVAMSVLDRLVMGLLEYTGPHIDARTFKRASSSGSQRL